MCATALCAILAYLCDAAQPAAMIGRAAPWPSALGSAYALQSQDLPARGHRLHVDMMLLPAAQQTSTEHHHHAKQQAAWAGICLWTSNSGCTLSFAKRRAACRLRESMPSPAASQSTYFGPSSTLVLHLTTCLMQSTDMAQFCHSQVAAAGLCDVLALVKHRSSNRSSVGAPEPAVQQCLVFFRLPCPFPVEVHGVLQTRWQQTRLCYCGCIGRCTSAGRVTIFVLYHTVSRVSLDETIVDVRNAMLEDSVSALAAGQQPCASARHDSRLSRVSPLTPRGSLPGLHWRLQRHAASAALMSCPAVHAMTLNKNCWQLAQQL